MRPKLKNLEEQTIVITGSTAFFSPRVFNQLWATDSQGPTPIWCSGYDERTTTTPPRLTGCSGLLSAPARGSSISTYARVAAGTPLVAVDDAIVVEAGSDGGRGNHLALHDRKRDRTYVYFHMNAPAEVSRGDEIAAGERVGAVGCTGSCWGDHLHFEVRSGADPRRGVGRRGHVAPAAPQDRPEHTAAVERKGRQHVEQRQDDIDQRMSPGGLRQGPQQRFGVAQKDLLRQLRLEVDVLALSATPIPRTLHMSLTGIRDMSTMETAPEDRLPVKTFVSEWDDHLIREAILRELDRGGQIYFVHNRVNNIELIARRLRELSVYSEILPPSTPAEEIARRQPVGIILSGGPKSVSEPGAPKTDPRLLELGTPAAQQPGCRRTDRARRRSRCSHRAPCG